MRVAAFCDRHRKGANRSSLAARSVRIAPPRSSNEATQRASCRGGIRHRRNDCHTHPSYAPGHDPFLGQPEQIDADQYLTGGRQFGPFTSANLTPDALGRPAGLTLDEFITLLRTGHDPDAPAGSPPLQVMPWPVVGKKTDRDLRAIYEYLRAIPSRPDNPNPGP